MPGSLSASVRGANFGETSTEPCADGPSVPTFCDVRPLSERDIRAAEQTQTVQAPLVARVALPFAVIPGLIAALQEQLRSFQEAQQTAEVPPAPKGQLH